MNIITSPELMLVGISVNYAGENIFARQGQYVQVYETVFAVIPETNSSKNADCTTLHFENIFTGRRSAPSQNAVFDVAMNKCKIGSLFNT